jgi:hypothetical protein
MASWREIDRIRKDPVAVRRVAKTLIAMRRDDTDFTEWEMIFLQQRAAQPDGEELTTRQAEKLLQIRDDYELLTEYRRFSVKILLQGCYDARLDLNEDDEEWVVKIRERNSLAIRRKHIGRLMRLARQLYLVEEHEAA